MGLCYSAGGLLRTFKLKEVIVRHVYKIALTVAAFAAALSLSGCILATDAPIYKTGVGVDVAGILSCASPEGSPSFVSIAQRPADSNHPDSTSYRAFMNHDGTVYDLLFEQTSIESKYLVQAKEIESGATFYLWYNKSNREFTYTDGSNSDVVVVAKKYHVPMDHDSMSGNPDNIKKLLDSLAEYDFNKYLTCVPG